MKTKIVIDTNEFIKWSQKRYKLSNNRWVERIWHPYMMEHFEDSSGTVLFKKTKNPANVFEEHINDFIDAHPQFNKGVWMENTD